MSDLKIKKLDENDPTALYHHYAGQIQPQDVYLELDCDEGTLEADWDGEIGGGVPANVWHHRVRRYPIPVGALPTAVNELMVELTPLFERVLAGYSCEWDGSNHVGRLNDDACDAEEKIETIASDPDIPRLAVWDAGDWYEGMGRQAVIDEYGVTPHTDTDDLVERMRADADSPDGGPMLLERLEEYAAELIEISGDDD